MSRWHPEQRRWLAVGAAVLMTLASGVPGQAASPAPSANAVPSASPAPTASPAATPLSTVPGATPLPSPGPLADLAANGFPRRVLGLPVLDVVQARALLDAGALAGRAVAIGGWWTDPPVVPCPAPRHHEPVVSGWCMGGGALVGRPDPVLIITTTGGTTTELSYVIPPDGLSAVVAQETAGHDRVHPDTGDLQEVATPAPVVVIAHAADPRALECRPDDRARCTAMLVIDRFAWVDGDRPGALVDTGTTTTWPGAEMARLRMLGAVAGSGVVVTYGAWPTNVAQEVDPRLGTAIVGRTWIGRVIAGPVAADGAAPLALVTLDALLNPTGTLPMAPAAADVPAALFPDATDQGRTAWLEVVRPDGTVEYRQRLSGTDTRPPVLAPGEHTLLVAVGRRALRKLSPTNATCSASVTAAAAASYEVRIAGKRGACTIRVDPMAPATPQPSAGPAASARPIATAAASSSGSPAPSVEP